MYKGIFSWIFLFHLGNCTKMLHAIFNKSWKQHPQNSSCKTTVLPSLKPSKLDEQDMLDTAGDDKLISDVFLWTIFHRPASVERPIVTYLQQLPTDTGCSLEDLPKAMDDRDKWRRRVRENRAISPSYWWWYIDIRICLCTLFFFFVCYLCLLFFCLSLNTTYCICYFSISLLSLLYIIVDSFDCHTLPQFITTLMQITH